MITRLNFGEVTKIISVTNNRISNVECLSDTFTSQDCVDKLERRIERLENFLNKIMPMLPDELKLYLEVSDD